MSAPPQAAAAATSGHVVHWAARYDALVWLLTFGKERRFRERLLEPARLRAGEAVLDVGCGTGTLAIAAKRQVGLSGSVCGVDPSPEMIARAQRKAAKAGAAVDFRHGLAQSLPFADGRFDVVLSTVMLHHLARADRPGALREMRRVLKPGGRLLAVDFATVSRGQRGLLAHFHRHGRQDPADFQALVSDAGVRIVDSGRLGVWDLLYVLAEVPRP